MDKDIIHDYTNITDLLDALVASLNKAHARAHGGKQWIRLVRHDDENKEWKAPDYRQYKVEIRMLADDSVALTEQVVYNPTVMSAADIFRCKDTVHFNLLRAAMSWGVEGHIRYRKDIMDWSEFEKRQEDKKKEKEEKEEKEEREREQREQRKIDGEYLREILRRKYSYYIPKEKLIEK